MPRLFLFSLIQMNLSLEKVGGLMGMMDDKNSISEEDLKPLLVLIGEELSSMLSHIAEQEIDIGTVLEGKIVQDKEEKDVFTILIFPAS